MSVSSAFQSFYNCLPVGAQAQLDEMLDNWSRDFNLRISSPHAAYVSDLMKRENALEQLFCINSFLDQEIATAEANFSGLLGFVDACLEQAFSREGYDLRLRLQEALTRMASSRAGLQLAAIQDQLMEVQATRDSLNKQNDLALRIQNGALSSPPFVVTYTTDRESYTPEDPVIFDLEASVSLQSMEVSIPRVDQPQPFFDEVPDTAIESRGAAKRRVTVYLPEDYAGNSLSVKFFLVSTRLETSTFFVKFDRQRGYAPPRGKYVRRPCPPIQ